MTVGNVMAEIEKVLTNKNVVLSELEKRHFEQLLEDLRQTGYSDGFDEGYFSGRCEEYDLESTSVD